MFPYCADWSELKDPERKKKYDAGPHGTLTVWSGPPAMGPKIAATFVFYLVASIFVGYVAAMVLARGAELFDVFRLTSTVGVAALCLGFIPNAIWFGKSWGSILTDLMDGLVYARIFGLVYGWLWPTAG